MRAPDMCRIPSEPPRVAVSGKVLKLAVPPPVPELQSISRFYCFGNFHIWQLCPMDMVCISGELPSPTDSDGVLRFQIRAQMAKICAL